MNKGNIFIKNFRIREIFDKGIFYSTFANGEVRAISFIAKYTAKGYGL